MSHIEDNLSEDDTVALSPRGDQDDVVEIESSVEKVRFGKRVILVAVAPGCPVTVATFGIAKGLDVETEIRERIDKMENDAKFVCFICEPYLKTHVIVNKTYKAITGKRKMQNAQLEFPDGTSLDMLLFILDMQLRGLVFKKVAIEMPKGSDTPLTERVVFRSYSKPAFYMNVDMTIASQKKPKKTSKKEKLDLSSITGKPVKKRFSPKKKD